MQQGMKIPKWMPRARVGIYFGRSPKHARNIASVLNLRTGFVSPQFHVKFDDTFEKVRGIREDSHDMWRRKCYIDEEPKYKCTGDKSKNEPKVAKVPMNDTTLLPTNVPSDSQDEIPDLVNENYRLARINDSNANQTENTNEPPNC
jgi:hypothetical protein